VRLQPRRDLQLVERVRVVKSDQVDRVCAAQGEIERRTLGAIDRDEIRFVAVDQREQERLRVRGSAPGSVHALDMHPT